MSAARLSCMPEAPEGEEIVWDYAASEA